ncbi:Lrp/AsnC family leucine-responsive transcriptional regulator [Mesoflavibacter sabulilitoris]|jgi:Lrp/AsnC family leucine-responsive transcriptional regulator|uniref:AsnC family transcriptional regulator n=1 Tax=Mesoflavibacter zeaxanthinifaciens subsp. sabulilitoris TaxID=1520893 RepID=A0A2T1NH43_9FLAO|nr:Lrp/AsnC family transcriptional regulator [Mesoflavibacter zeaxanthinifaciens]MBB3122765.1 Lrp/AsnC family leucine-responsive transcriptional regulator [Mesoflavibacter zeaxanthinifaciens subsp. sabulilitoris]MCP4053015.1 Lrp/AsnC family transcriptional regulator [Mesoflavibacter sp.]PSG92150.1 AsnC family transcriptional regulator [Mesoflavibacter zeaxanthinifaciens subsp. sabulilitoris]
MVFDDIDKKLLQLLQNDSKQTNKALANQLNLSVTAVFERIKKLENQGVISKYVVLVNKEKIDKSFVTFCHIKLIQHMQEYVIQFEKEVNKLTEVIECYHISGDYDYLLKVAVKDMEEFRKFMVEKLTNIKHIGSTHSMFVISEVKHTTAISV